MCARFRFERKNENAKTDDGGGGRAVGEIEAAMEFEEVTNWRVNTNQMPTSYGLPCKVVQLNDIMNTLFEVVIRARAMKRKKVKG